MSKPHVTTVLFELPFKSPKAEDAMVWGVFSSPEKAHAAVDMFIAEWNEQVGEFEQISKGNFGIYGNFVDFEPKGNPDAFL
jgi:hypothetical protein